MRSARQSARQWLLHQADLSLTVEGTLNPGIIHPQWLAREGLLQAPEADNANIELAADDYSLFRTRDFTTEVTRDSLSMATRSEEFESSLREIFSGTLQLLRHTPVTELTISRFKYWRADPSETHFVGPLDWSNLAMVDGWSDLIENPSPRGIAINGRTADGTPVTMAIEPDEEDGLELIYVGCRYDWKLRENDGMVHLQQVLNEHWDATRQHADAVSKFALSLLRQQQRES
jgi:hypothetical protein